MAYCTSLLCCLIVLCTFSVNQEHAQIAGTVTLDHDVLRVIYRDSVSYEVVSVYFRLRTRYGNFPYVVLSTGHVDCTAPRIWHP